MNDIRFLILSFGLALAVFSADIYNYLMAYCPWFKALIGF